MASRSPRPRRRAPRVGSRSPMPWVALPSHRSWWSGRSAPQARGRRPRRGSSRRAADASITPLPVVEPPGLSEDAIGDADLADVMEQEAVLGARVIHQLGADRPGQLERVALHALGVGAGACVLGFEGARQSRDGFLVGILDEEPAGRARARAGGADRGHRAGAAPRRAAPRRVPGAAPPEPAGEPLDDVEKLQRAERLGRKASAADRAPAPSRRPSPRASRSRRRPCPRRPSRAGRARRRSCREGGSR